MIRAIVIAAVITACAAAGSNGPGEAQNVADASGTPRDAHAVTADGSGSATKMDGGVLLDAFVYHDAAKPPPDAAGGGLCSDNTMCISGQCCWVIACVPGTAVGSNLCFPM